MWVLYPKKDVSVVLCPTFAFLSFEYSISYSVSFIVSSSIFIFSFIAGTVVNRASSLIKSSSSFVYSICSSKRPVFSLFLGILLCMVSSILYIDFLNSLACFINSSLGEMC